MLKVYRALSTLLLVVIALQFFLAGRGTFTAAYEGHRSLGYIVMVVTVVTLVVGAVGRAPAGAMTCTAVAFALMFLQPILAGLGKELGAESVSTGGLFFGLHAVNAVAIVSLLANSVRRLEPRRVRSSV